MSNAGPSPLQGDLAGSVLTVLGLIDPKDLGVTLAHEHLLCDVRFAFDGSAANGSAAQSYEPVTASNSWWLRQVPEGNLDNLALDDVTAAATEVQCFLDDGGRTIVELSVRGIGPDPVGLRRISELTGAHVVTGTGYYKAGTRPREFDLATAEEIAAQLASDVLVGMGVDRIRAGIIGELGIEGDHPGSMTALGMGIANIHMIGPSDRKLLEAAAIAQRLTGAAISVHLPHSTPDGDDPATLACGLLELLEGFGADLRRVVIGHLDRSERVSVDSLLEVVKTGAVVEFDEWGLEGYVDASDHANPLDEQRIRWVEGLVRAGAARHLLFSSDIFTKHRWRQYGGTGYSHVLRFIVPRMRRRGIGQDVIDTILIENPRRILTLEKAAPAKS